jgi:hypothetical protein
MPLPGQPQTFAFPNCRGLLSKLEREIDRYSEARRAASALSAPVKEVDDMRDAAFNAAITAWHLCDWVYEDLTEEQCDKLDIKSLRALRERAIAECPALKICRLAATASKHWTVTQKPDDRVKVVVGAMPEWTILFYDDAGKEIEAGVAFEQVFAFWNQFIFQNKIAQ